MPQAPIRTRRARATGPGPRRTQALKAFLAIADALSRNGIVVMRVDDRGAGRSSGQKQLSSVQQLAGDLVAGVAFLKTRPEVDLKRIGIIGHSFAASRCR